MLIKLAILIVCFSVLLFIAGIKFSDWKFKRRLLKNIMASKVDEHTLPYTTQKTTVFREPQVLADLKTNVDIKENKSLN